MEQNDLYMKIKQHITKCIYDGVYSEGEKIPSERLLAEMYKVSRVTIRKSLELLEKEGILEREVGVGTTVHLQNFGYDGSLDMIALIAPARDPFFSDFIEQFQKILESKDILLLYVQKPKVEAMEDCLFRFYQKGLRNAVVWLKDMDLDTDKIQRLRAIGMNMVFFDTDFKAPFVDSVLLHNQSAIDHLIEVAKEEKCEQLFYFGWDNQHICSVNERRQAFLEGTHANGTIFTLPWNKRESLKEVITQFLSEIPQSSKQKGIICGDGEIGIAVGKVLRSLKRKDFLVASVDEFSESKEYKITTICQEFGRIAQVIYDSIRRQCKDSRNWKGDTIKVEGSCIRRT